MFKRCSSTKRSLHFGSKTPTFLALLITILVLWIGESPNTHRAASKSLELKQDNDSKLIEADHYLYAATYSIRAASTSTLALNNPIMTRARTVRVTLYNKAGQPLTLPEITLGPAETKFLNLRDSISSERHGTFSEGSVEVHFHGPAMGITGQLMVSDDRHSQSFDVLLREDGNFAGSKVDSLWFSLDNQTTVQVFVTNTRPFPTTVTPTIYVNGAELIGEALALDSHEAESLDIGALLKRLGVRKGFASGGISLLHDGQPGAISVAGVISNKQRGFSSSMRFVDIAKQGSTTLHGANVLIGTRNTPPGLPQDANFTPRAVVRNTTHLPLQVRARVRYVGATGTGSIEIEPVTLNSREVKEMNLTPLVNELSGKEILDTGFELEHDGSPGSVIATVVSVDQSGTHVFDVPLKDPLSVKNVGGNHPWRLDGDNRAILHVKNIDSVSVASMREFALMINTAAGKYSFPLQLTAAGQTVAVDIRRLRDEQIPDNHGNVIPLHITEGEVEWYGRGPLGQFVGRLVQYNPTTGISSSMSCETPCDWSSCQELWKFI